MAKQDCVTYDMNLEVGAVHKGLHHMSFSRVDCLCFLIQVEPEPG